MYNVRLKKNEWHYPQTWYPYSFKPMVYSSSGRQQWSGNTTITVWVERSEYRRRGRKKKRIFWCWLAKKKRRGAFSEEKKVPFISFHPLNATQGIFLYKKIVFSLRDLQIVVDFTTSGNIDLLWRRKQHSLSKPWTQKQLTVVQKLLN